MYLLLTSQLAPLAIAVNAKDNLGRTRVSVSEKSAETAQPISNTTQVAPVPQPLPQPAPVPLAVNIVATKTDNRTVAQPAAPGDTINYTVVIQNLGSTDATNVSFLDTIDANTTLVPSSIVSTPIANNDTYNVIGNVRIQPNAAQGLLSNDFNPDNGNATGITASGPATSTNGGSVTVNADGSFSYNPPVGFAGTDTFTYTLTVTATTKTDTATVTLNVGNGTATPGTNVVWFINPAAAPGGDGRLTSPFNCYTGAGCFSTVAADEAGDIIFLFSGALTGGDPLLNNQKLIGQGASNTLANIAGLTVPIGSDALPTTGGASPTITTVIAATVGVPLAQGNTLRGFTVGNVTGTKISGNNFGTLTVGNNTTPDVILNGSGRALGLVTGTFAATSGFAGVTTTSSTAQGILLTSVAGTVSFGSTTVSGATSQGVLISTSTADINFGNTTVTGGTDAISLQNNSAGTRTFGTITVSGNSGIGFLHSVGGGTTTVTGATTITNPTGTGISIQNSTTAVSFAATTVNKGASAGTGVDLGNNSGNTTFASLSITTSNGTGLLGVGNTGQINVTTNAGSIASTGGAAINISKLAAPATPVTLNFSTVSSTNSTTLGVTLDRVSGNLTNTTTTTTNPTGAGIQVQNTSAGGTMNFGNTTSTTSSGTGVNLVSNAGAVTFADLDIAPDASVTAFSASNSTGVTSSTSGTISTTDAPAISVTNSPLSMTLTSVSADNTGDGDSCVSLTTASGTLNMQGGALIGGTAAAFLVNGGTATITFAGTIGQSNAQRAVDVQNKTGGTTAFSGAITASTSTANAIHLTSNGGATTNFTGGLSLTTTSGIGFNATGGGTISATQNNTSIVNTISSTTGTALNVTTTTIGASGLTFRSIAANGAASGIILTTTGAGALTITGNAGSCTSVATCTGGAIQNSTGPGINLTSTGAISLTNVAIEAGGDDGIRGLTVNGFTLTSSRVVNNGNAVLERGIEMTNLVGTSSITNSLVSGNAEDNLYVKNGSGTLNLTTSGSTYANNSSTVGNDGIHFLGADVSGSNNSNMSITVTNCTFNNNRGDHFQATTDAVSSATQTIIFQNNSLTGDRGVTFGGNDLGAGITLNPSGTATVNFNISNNGQSSGTPTNQPWTGAVVSAITINSSSNSTMSGTINSNIIGSAALADSGSSQGDGINITANNSSDITVAITNNTIRQYANLAGLNLSVVDGTTDTLNATITGNTIATPGSLASNGIFAQAGATATDTSFMCIDIGGAGALANSIAGSGANGGTDFRVRQRFGTTVRLPGYAGASTDTAAVVTFIQGRNAGAETGSATVQAPGGGFVGGAACTAPTLAPETLFKTPESISAPADIETTAAVVQGLTTKAGVVGVVSPSESKAQMFVPDAGVRGKVETREVKQKAGKPQDKDVDGITPKLANFPLTIGTLGAGKSVTITFSVTVNNPLVPPSTTSVSNQGTVSGNDGATPFNILTDDPDVAGTNNPTITGIVAPPDIFARDARVAEPTSGTTNMLFTVALSAPAPGAVSVNYATANGGATPATAGVCGSGGDYVATSGTVNFTAGQQLQTVAVQVCSDGTVEPDETLLLNLSSPVNGNISDGQATGTITANVPGATLISELRTSGPSGAGDDFVELYNNSDSPLTVTASDASPGYGLFKSGAASGDTPVLIGTIPNGTVIPARGHYLLVGSAYSLANYGGTGAAAGNLTLTADIENDRNVGLFDTTNVTNLSSTTRIDAVGFGTNTGGNFDLLREGTNLPAAGGSTAQYSFVRKLTTGLPQDTNDNLADLVIVSPDPSVAIGSNPTPILGAPGPENATNPIQRNATVKASLVDPAAASTVSPNRIRDTNAYTDALTPSSPSGAGGAYTLGTLLIRRKFTNNTGAPVTRLRFRIVDITSTNAPPGGGGQADVRALTSATQASVTITGGGTVTVQGLTLEQPPIHLRGGGLNSSLSAGTITLATPLAAGANLNFNFLLGVATGGSYRFFINVEALP
jgi:hypothetical protein